MTAYDFSLVKNTTITFNAAVLNGDTLNFGGTTSAKDVTVAASGTTVTLTVGTDRLTLNGVTLAQLGTHNITFTDTSSLSIGENTADSALDAAGNTITIASTKNNQAYGLGGGDTINLGANTGNNIIFGGTGAVDSADGNDTITAGSGNNAIYGNGGNDTISFQSANGTVTTLYGGAGDDTVTVTAASTGQASIFGGTGSDNVNLTAFAYAGNHTIFGGTGVVDAADAADTITSGTGNAVVYGNGGADTITLSTAAAGLATVYGGAGNDTISGSNTSYTPVIYGNDGGDTITNVNGTGNATIYGGSGIADSLDGADSITVGTGSTVVYANAGNDTIVAGTVSGTATVVAYGGLGNDTFNYVAAGGNAADGTTVSFFGGTGDDVYQMNFTGSQNNVVISEFGTGDIVQITLSGGSATSLDVSGGGSSPVIFNDTGANGYTANSDERITFTGFTGDFSATNFVISDGSKLITNFSSTATTLTGGATADQLVSGTANDTFVGGGGVDKLTGGSGNNTFQFTSVLAAALDSTNTTVTGGTGTDTFEVTGAAVTLADNDFARVTTTEVLKVANFAGNSVTLAAAAQAAGIRTFDGSALTNAVTVAAGSYTTGMTITGGTGSDVITIGSGNDSVTGGTGDDTVNVASANLTSQDTIAGGTGTDNITMTDAATVIDSDFTSVTSVETLNLFAGAGAQSVTLGALSTTAGVVLVNGASASGALTVNGSALTAGVRINGGSTTDSFTGGTGVDTLVGGGGADTLTGGTGPDRFVFEQAGTGNGTDVLTASDLTAGVGGDIFDFVTKNTIFNGGVTETVVAAATTAGVTQAAVGNNGVIVITQDAVGNAAALKTAIDATDFEAFASGPRVVVWEIDATNVGIAVLTNTDNGATTNDAVVTQVANIGSFADQAAVSAFTAALVAGNFDII